MKAVGLGAFIVTNREALVRKYRARAANMADWPLTRSQIDRDIPVFLDQLVAELHDGASDPPNVQKTAADHGGSLFARGFTVSQVVHDYGNVCQSVTELAIDMAVPISTSDFRLLNRCLDNAIADAVSEHTRQRQLIQAGESGELRTLIQAAIAAFEAVQAEHLDVTDTTTADLGRCLHAIRARLGEPPRAS